jgi:AcrR family transcriptional regulator
VSEGEPTFDEMGMSDRKSTQRERLLQAMRAIVVEAGYRDATIAQVIKAAGVSRPTFYEYFRDKEDCFLAVLDGARELVLEELRGVVADAPPEQAAYASATGLVALAKSNPAVVQLVVIESLAAGTRALDIRDMAIRQIADGVERRYDDLDAETPVPDISADALLGTVQRLLAPRLRHSQAALSRLEDELPVWLESYAAPLSQHRWRALAPITPTVPPPRLMPLLAPSALSPGRPRLSKEQVAEIHRQRILFAAAEISERDGYSATTIGEITKLAGVDSRVFHSLFSDKSDLFVAVHEMHFQRVMSLTASAFFTEGSWPERIWEAGRVFAAVFEESSTLARVSFVESPGGGPSSQERGEQLVGAFKIFLHEGYQYAEPSPAPSPLALEAIAATIFEIAYRQTRQSAKPDLYGLLPHVAFLIIAPFLGTKEANAFIAERPPSDGRRLVGSPQAVGRRVS